MRAGLSDNVMISAKAQNLHHQQLIENQKDFLYKLIIRDYMNHTKKFLIQNEIVLENLDHS